MVPTFRRPLDLRRALRALAVQQRPADEVIVVLRKDDSASWEVLNTVDAAALRLRPVTVGEPGVVQALNAGLAEVGTEIVAITDDDAAPYPDWTKRIVAHFEARPDVAGVGGRDLIRVGDVLQLGRARVVGKVPLIGKHIGNHHIGYGDAREVDTLKGVNGAYRTDAIRDIGFDTRLLGTGAQVYWEISLGLALQRAGWKLIYDPNIVVDHYLGARFDEDQRSSFNAIAVHNIAYNEMLIKMDQLSGLGRPVFLAWAVLAGTRTSPGLIQWVRFVPREGLLAGAKLRATLSGRFHAWRDGHAVQSNHASFI